MVEGSTLIEKDSVRLNSPIYTNQWRERENNGIIYTLGPILLSQYARVLAISF